MQRWQAACACFSLSALGTRTRIRCLKSRTKFRSLGSSMVHVENKVTYLRICVFLPKLDTARRPNPDTVKGVGCMQRCAYADAIVWSGTYPIPGYLVASSWKLLSSVEIHVVDDELRTQYGGFFNYSSYGPTFCTLVYI